MGKNYWLHRVSHEGGIGILEHEHKLTIGFGDAAASDDVRDALAKCDWAAFCKAYTSVYGGEIERTKGNLWRFVVDMKIGDLVVVPYPWGFCICAIRSDAIRCNRPDKDLGWERSVEVLADDCTPRDAYADASLVSCMKFRGTNRIISDYAESVESALDRRINKNPFNLLNEVGKQLLSTLRGNGTPEWFEQNVASFFEVLGAETHIFPKNYSGKKGDCDIEATFPLLHQVISVQCKKHEGITGDWGVQQITKYAEGEGRERKEGWTYINWVISLADDYSDEAKAKAREKDVVLINGEDFCRMLLSAGIH